MVKPQLGQDMNSEPIWTIQTWNADESMAAYYMANCLSLWRRWQKFGTTCNVCAILLLKRKEPNITNWVLAGNSFLSWWSNWIVTINLTHTPHGLWNVTMNTNVINQPSKRKEEPSLLATHSQFIMIGIKTAIYILQSDKIDDQKSFPFYIAFIDLISIQQFYVLFLISTSRLHLQ